MLYLFGAGVGAILLPNITLAAGRPMSFGQQATTIAATAPMIEAHWELFDYLLGGVLCFVAILSSVVYAFAHNAIVLDRKPPLIEMAAPLASAFSGTLTAAIFYLFFGSLGDVATIGAITNGILFLAWLWQAFKFAFLRAG